MVINHLIRCKNKMNGRYNKVKHAYMKCGSCWPQIAYEDRLGKVPFALNIFYYLLLTNFHNKALYLPIVILWVRSLKAHFDFVFVCPIKMSHLPMLKTVRDSDSQALVPCVSHECWISLWRLNWSHIYLYRNMVLYLG
jgi:hypothetical protein